MITCALLQGSTQWNTTGSLSYCAIARRGHDRAMVSGAALKPPYMGMTVLRIKLPWQESENRGC